MEMKHYEKLLRKGSFSRGELIEIVGTPAAARVVIYEYPKRIYREGKKKKCWLTGKSYKIKSVSI